MKPYETQCFPQCFPPEVVGHYLEALCPGIKSARARFLGGYSAQGMNIQHLCVYTNMYINDILLINVKNLYCVLHCITVFIFCVIVDSKGKHGDVVLWSLDAFGI